MTLDLFLKKIGAQQFVRVVCAWCPEDSPTRLILDGPPDLPVSHGMCQVCQDRYGFEVEGDDND